MKRIVLAVLFGVGFLVSTIAPAIATDESRFNALVGKYAIDSQAAALGHFTPKAACACSPGTDNDPGFLTRNTFDGKIRCTVPDFTNGVFTGSRVCNTFEVLGK